MNKNKILSQYTVEDLKNPDIVRDIKLLLEVEDLQEELDYGKRVLENANNTAEKITCRCNDSNCKEKGEEDDYVARHIEDCSCCECHHAIGKLR